jgi:anthranilate 1,2-dioxygenase small subunit
MDSQDLRYTIEELLHAYVQCIDEDRLEAWPEFFTEDCVYKILPRENVDQGLPIALMYCDSRGMLQDRIVAHRQANLFAPHVYRHLVSAIRVTGQNNGVITARANYAVFRTTLDPVHYGTTEVYSVGEYRDQIVFANGVARFKEKIVVVDTSKIQSLLVTPL